jgi:hypothetical protein
VYLAIECSIHACPTAEPAATLRPQPRLLINRIFLSSDMRYPYC